MPGRMRKAAWTFVAALLAAPAPAQLVETNPAGLRMGHVHLNVTDADAHRRFWTAVMGGTIVMHGPLELIQFPGTYLILQEVEPPPPAPAGSIVNHFGFVVQDMPKMLAAWKAAELP